MSFSDQVSRRTNVTALPEGDDRDPRFIIAVDYGTTYTGVAWILTKGPDEGPPTLADIKAVQNWGSGIGDKVPSAYTYAPKNGSDWGYGIGEGSYVIRLTKLDLERPTRLKALEQLVKTLRHAGELEFTDDHVTRGEVPRHLTKSSLDVMTAYLKNVANEVYKDIANNRDPAALDEFPIDLIITHPAVWDQRATNLTFRAVTTAFSSVFSGLRGNPGYVRMTTEPEACAQYTLQDARSKSLETMREGECFIVVDAGGGTVDVVSYRVDSAHPNMRISRVTNPQGEQCGASQVDRCFLNDFLPARLGGQDYARLMGLRADEEQHGYGTHYVLGRGQIMMLEKFESIKHNFAGRAQRQPQLDNALQLPPDLGIQNDPERGIRNGLLIISAADLEDMFSGSVQGTINLIEKQLVQLDTQGYDSRTIVLSGGFSRSRYLYSKIQERARSRNFTLLRGDDSWTAVAKGAVLMGLGRGCEVPPECVRCPYHIGVVAATRYGLYDYRGAAADRLYKDSFDEVERARDHVTWLFAKNDLVPTTEWTEKSVRIQRKFLRANKKVGTITVALSGQDWRTGRPPMPADEANDATRHEVKIDYDLDEAASRYRGGGSFYETVADKKSGILYDRVTFIVEISLKQSRGRVRLLLDRGQGIPGAPSASGHELEVKVLYN
ncbi:hypothetical protein RB595_004779 [Gaeumannomyces hyphopodioides]